MDVGALQAELNALEGLFDAGRLAEVIARGERLAARFPDSFMVHQMLGTAHGMLGRNEEAAAWLRRAVEAKPDFAAGYLNLGVALDSLGRRAEAVASYEQAVRLLPDFAEAWHCLGSTLQALGRLEEAAAAYRNLLRMWPGDSEIHYQLAVVLRGVGQLDEAANCCWRALEIRPDFSEARLLLIGCYQRAVELEPGHAQARSSKLHQQAHICDWDGLRADAHLIADLGVVGNAAVPFSMLSFDDDPERDRRRSENYAAKKFPSWSPPLPAGRRSGDERIRIGYFSADFYEHATMHLMAGLFELHDRRRFSIHIFSYGPDRDDAAGRRLKGTADSYHDVRDLSDEAVAALARREGIDIAVDLKGYTFANRLGIFGYRAAPVQISYLGYPGPLGTPFLDYIVADSVVIPAEQRPHYAENIIFLPDSYQVNDRHRVISDRPVSRTEAGLPESGFVFCSFNNSYKISPREFDIWMRLMDRVDGSVLWLLRANSLAESNLRKEAQKRGIDPDRLIFAERMPLPEHLARHALADLFLDTFNCGAHTTASDALWAGLPLITLIGRSFAARVGASLLTAVGLPELIAETAEEYEQLALELAQNPQRLSGIRQKLAANRLTEPLFDTERFTRHIEAAYARAYAASIEGRQPADIVI